MEHMQSKERDSKLRHNHISNYNKPKRTKPLYLKDCDCQNQLNAIYKGSILNIRTHIH